MRKEMTPWERKLWYQFLRTCPVRFQRQKPIGNCIADFYCAKAALVIELDGGGHYTPKAKERDEYRTRMLERQGLMVLRLCNTDIYQRFDAVCSVIEETVQKRTANVLFPVQKMK